MGEDASLPLVAPRLDFPAESVFRWEFYSPHHKVELTSHAFVEAGELFVVDPIPLDEREVERLLQQGKPKAILLTNGNHWRDTAWWRERLGIDAWASAGAASEIGEGVLSLPEADTWLGWRILSLPGGATGETAFLRNGCAVVGDAVVNLPKRGLEILPEKYCNDNAMLCKSLEQLVDAKVEQLFTAHGNAVLTDAAERVGELL